MKNTVENIVLTQRDDNGNIKANIADYYEQFIKPMEDKYKDSDLHTRRTAICPLPNHNDTDPSFGLTNHKFFKGVKVYHCFGCGGSGTIIRLHQRMQLKYHNKELTERESALDLAKIYNIDLGKASDEVEADTDDSTYMNNMRALKDLEGTYTVRDFQQELLEIRKTENLSLETRAKAVNRSIVKMLATDKHLYD